MIVEYVILGINGRKGKGVIGVSSVLYCKAHQSCGLIQLLYVPKSDFETCFHLSEFSGI
jgi:hypothetical protein